MSNRDALRWPWGRGSGEAQLGLGSGGREGWGLGHRSLLGRGVRLRPGSRRTAARADAAAGSEQPARRAHRRGARRHRRPRGRSARLVPIPRQRGVEANQDVEVGAGASGEVEGARARGHGLDPVVLGHPLDGHLPVLWDLRNGDGLAAVVDEDCLQGGGVGRAAAAEESGRSQGASRRRRMVYGARLFGRGSWGRRRAGTFMGGPSSIQRRPARDRLGQSAPTLAAGSPPGSLSFGRPQAPSEAAAPRPVEGGDRSPAQLTGR